MRYTKEDIVRKLKEYRALTLIRRQMEFELEVDIQTDTSRRDAIMLQLSRVSTEIQRMEFYISLLGEEFGEAVKAIYMKGVSQREAAASLFIDKRTLARRKESGVELLVEMYNRLPEP